MRKHSEEFKNKINLIGRELDSKLTFGETELGNDQLNAVTPVLQSSLLKSVMKELDIDSNVDIPVGTIVNYKFGVLLDSGDYEYLDYGNYQIYSSEKQEDNNAYNIVAYDKMLNSMVEYTKLKKENVKFPISVRDYITYLCEDIGLEFKNKEDEFANYNRMIESDLYANLGYTYRDIFDELAQVTASNIIINENDEVEIKYITSTGEIETTSSNNNNIIEVDNIPKQNARSLIVYGNSFQETRSGKNLYNYTDTTTVTSDVTADEDGWITINGDNQIATYYNYWTNGLNLKENTDYAIVLEIKSVSGTGRIYPVSTNIIGAQFDTEVYYDFSELKEGDVKVNLIHSNKDYKPGDLEHQYGLRTHTDFNEEQDGELIFRLSVLEDTSITPEQFIYEPYGALPNPEFPSEIKCVEGNLQLVDTGKNLFNDKQATVALSSGADASTLPTGVKLTANKTNLEISCIAYKLDDLTNFVGKTVRMKTNFSYTKNIHPRYNLGLCDATGNIRHSIVYSDNSGETISLVVPDDLGETKYLCVWLYLNLNRDREYDIGDTCEFNELIVTIDNEDMTYEPYQKTETYIDIGNNKLCKINDTLDELDIVSGKGIKRIGEYICTGDEGLKYSSGNDSQGNLFQRCYFQVENMKTALSGRQEIKSNYFKYMPNIGNIQNNDSGQCFIAERGNIYFYLPHEYDSADKYKEWLKAKYDEGNPVIFKWILESPQEFTTEPVNIQLRKGYNKIEIKDKNELINKLDLTYQLDDDTIDEEYLKDVNVKFGEKYGPINSIVLSRSAGADNIYLQDEQSVADNGLCELKISDNQIMNFNDRSDYLHDILEKLDGLEYYINDFSSTGVCYYEIADRYNVKVFDNTYPCVMFNDEIDVSQGLAENIYTDLPEQAETDYTKADKTDRKINQTYIIVDKQNQTIESVINQVGEQGEKITQNEQTIDGFKQTVSDLQKTVEESGFITEEVLNSAIEQSAGKIEASVNDKITDSEGNIKKDVTGQLALYIKKGATNDVVSAFNLATDEVTIDSKNFKLAANGNITATGGKIGGWTIGSDRLSITNGNYNIMLMNASNNNKDVLIVREGTNTYPFYLRGDGTLQATKATIKGNITATGGNIGGFNITANSLKAKMTHIFPNMTADDVEKIRQYLLGHVTLTSAEQEKYDLNKDGVVSLIDMQMARQIQVGSISKNYTGYFKINTTDMQKAITLSGLNSDEAIIINMFGNITCNSLKTSSITCDSISFLQNITNMIRRETTNLVYLEVTIGGYGSYGIDMWSSDKRLKENINDSNYNALDKILSIKHREFDYKNKGHIKNGYVADELEEIDSDFIFEVGDDKMKQPRIDTLIPAITKAIQEQQEMINKLNEEIINLKSELENYRKEVNSNEK